MPCYKTTIKPPSRADYAQWKEAGYLGTWEQYLGAKSGDEGTVFLCGDLGDHCAECAGVGEYLCDFPVGEEKTCDRSLCWKHAREIAPNLHYCEAHYQEWRAFRDSGGVADRLKNVVAFKEEK